jgi:geranylgeranyl pyrophosphate synthase
MTNLNTHIHPLINEVETRMQAQLAGNPSTLIASLEPQIQIGEKNLTRPTLTLLFGSLFELDQNTLIDLAASIEMLHRAKLVHDNLFKESSGPIRDTPFITSATVLAGDLAFAAAARLATAPQSTAVMRIFSETLQLMVSGEITHMFQNGNGFKRAAYYRRIHAQTASLFELACHAIAILAATEEEIVKTARQFGYEIGMADQIVQDALTLIAYPARSAGPVHQNFPQGIATLPTIYYFENHAHNPDVQSILNHNGHGPQTLERVITDIQHSNAITQTYDEAKAFVQRGLEMLHKLPNTTARTELEQLVTQIVPSDI